MNTQPGIAEDSVVAEVEITAPPERVFQALTTGEELMRWWISPTCELEMWKIDPRPGGRWRFKTGKSTQVINGVDRFEAHGEILEFSPPRMLVYTWIANWNDLPSQKTVVSWVLTGTKNGTHVKVTHIGLTKMPVARKDYASGWTGVLQLLKKFTEKGSGV
jgi:uncharacterized protein YndB with AHSA1/START domain